MAEVPGEGGDVTDRAWVAATLAGAVALGGGFPPSVPDTPANRALYEQIKAEIDAMPEGTIVDLPWEYTDRD